LAKTYDFVEDVKLNKAEFKLMIETIPGESGWVVTYFSKAFAKWGKQANVPRAESKAQEGANEKYELDEEWVANLNLEDRFGLRSEISERSAP